MKIIETIKEFAQLEAGCVLTIGNFDGVHIGHQKILSVAKEACLRGVRKKTPLVVAVFEPHPVSVLHPEKAPERLTILTLKENLLASFGADFLFLLKPDRAILSLSPDDFVKKIIVEHVRPSIVVEGEDFHFGENRTGNINTLTYLAGEFGFEVVIVEPAHAKLSIGPAVNISSTLIRNLLIDGKVADAAAALGRPYRLIGKIVPGKGKGKRLGFPTANLDNIGSLTPAEAVYAATAAIASDENQICKADPPAADIPAAVSIGRTETYGQGNQLLVEAHLLTENVGSLYGKWMALDFAEKIRSQQKFRSEKDLADQIANDCQLVLSACGGLRRAAKVKQFLPHPKI
jgi:riboflavin kinase / FMN adenylyltransferase